MVKKRFKGLAFLLLGIAYAQPAVLSECVPLIASIQGIISKRRGSPYHSAARNTG
jgi:hypothetical protein